MKFTVTNLFPLPSSPHLPNVTTLTALVKNTCTVVLYHTPVRITETTRKHPPATADVCARKSE